MIADVVGELVGLLEVLGGEEDRGALVVERPHLLPDRLAADRVEAGGRLVEEEHARLVDQRRGEVEAALHPARVAADAAVGGGDQVDPLEQVVGAPLALGAGQALQCGLQADQLAPGHQRVERGLLQGDPDRAAHRARFVDHVVPGDGGPPAGRQQQRGQHPHRRRLAGPVGAEEAVDFALLDLEVDALHGEHVVEGALQALHDDARSHGPMRRGNPTDGRLAGIVQCSTERRIRPGGTAESGPQPWRRRRVCSLRSCSEQRKTRPAGCARPRRWRWPALFLRCSSWRPGQALPARRRCASSCSARRRPRRRLPARAKSSTTSRSSPAGSRDT